MCARREKISLASQVPRICPLDAQIYSSSFEKQGFATFEVIKRLNYMLMVSEDTTLRATVLHCYSKPQATGTSNSLKYFFQF